MKKYLYIALGFAAGCMAASAFVHRRVALAIIKGEPIPEPPEWHRKWHPYFK